jgi:hypothetical protein
MINVIVIEVMFYLSMFMSAEVSKCFIQTTTTIKSIILSPELKAEINSGPAPNTDNIQLPPDITLSPYYENLTLPSSMTFDEKGTMYLAEAGYSDEALYILPRILKVDQNCTVYVLTDRGILPAVTDIVYTRMVCCTPPTRARYQLSILRAELRRILL